ncbi:MAG: MBL fold metallo-hydrolase [Pyrobaculum sp.]
MNIYFAGGIYVEAKGVRFVVDPYKPVRGRVDFVLVTHGHSDHVSRHVLRQFVVASEETFKALAARLGALPPRRIATAPGKVLEIGDVQVAVLEAGHIIGSVMYLVEVGGVQILFTGDFNTVGSIATDAADSIERPDILVMEATYGDSNYVFPNRAEIYHHLLETVEKYMGERGVAISAYPLGKAQEVAKLLGHRASAHPEVAKYNKALGVATGGGGDVVIVPSVKKAPSNYVKIEVSGWYIDKYIRQRAESEGVLGIPLSDHSDFIELVNFVERTSPRLVYVAYGFVERFSRHLKRRGVRAYPIPTSTLF